MTDLVRTFINKQLRSYVLFYTAVRWTIHLNEKTCYVTHEQLNIKRQHVSHLLFFPSIFGEEENDVGVQNVSFSAALSDKDSGRQSFSKVQIKASN